LAELSIQLVRSDAQAEQVRILAWEFIDWLRDRYPELDGAIDEYLVKQDFRGMLDRLLVDFAPPGGECLLAVLDDNPVGILMLKPHSDGICEMNRMFVRSQARGHGAGRALCSRLIERARELGYHEMVLSALNRHHEAIRLYHSLGFETVERAPETSGAANHEVPMRLAL
jgi:GNAT superfamily N-acetyltransferase